MKSLNKGTWHVHFSCDRNQGNIHKESMHVSKGLKDVEKEDGEWDMDKSHHPDN